MKKKSKIIIIGGGIGGLSLGPLLSNDNFEVEIFEFLLKSLFNGNKQKHCLWR